MLLALLLYLIGSLLFAAGTVCRLGDAYDMIQCHKRVGDHYGLWLEELSEEEYDAR